eukprot:CAMPEP_0206497438 /NCGR_PEP_ID=MMETSP0324_2-20121206/50193_1 /ASSEMBLY_ACC=CAM_ASM_000836 /TAXON_ID=2866 /ORGANISM="Crypthecodinium cohnii, Strain Seligo" /LENGTH=254 /DNA_ID=CAMNT_0053983023 /DNA_START=77 /DNA_END=843 /DNA_ORIENTATION=-
MRPWVIATPEVTERELTPADKLIVLGSDGVWDRMSSQEAVDIAARHRDPAAAAREISSVARQRWHQQTQGQMSDDITAVVVHLDFSSPPSPPPTPGGGPHGAAERLPSTGGLRRGRGKVPPEAVLRKDPPQRIGSRANSAFGGPRPAALFGTPADFPLQSSTSKPAATAAATGLERLPPMAAPTPPAKRAGKEGEDSDCDRDCCPFGATTQFYLTAEVVAAAPAAEDKLRWEIWMDAFSAFAAKALLKQLQNQQ